MVINAKNLKMKKTQNFMTHIIPDLQYQKAYIIKNVDAVVHLAHLILIP